MLKKLRFLVFSGTLGLLLGAGQARADVQVSVSLDVFDEVLSPFGAWVQVGGVGRVWQPYVEVVGDGFVPYSSGGQWVYSDDGWAFDSEWEWGWAPFHYGRWFHDEVYGWVWAPDVEWAPAWVDWRFGGGLVGWAPLPPPAVVVHYQPRWYFVEAPRFVEYDCRRYFLPAPRYHAAYAAAPVLQRHHGAWGPPVHDVSRVTRGTIPVPRRQWQNHWADRHRARFTPDRHPGLRVTEVAFPARRGPPARAERRDPGFQRHSSPIQAYDRPRQAPVSPRFDRQERQLDRQDRRFDRQERQLDRQERRFGAPSSPPPAYDRPRVDRPDRAPAPSFNPGQPARPASPSWRPESHSPRFSAPRSSGPAAVGPVMRPPPPPGPHGGGRSQQMHPAPGAGGGGRGHGGGPRTPPGRHP